MTAGQDIDLILEINIPVCPRKCRHCTKDVSCGVAPQKLEAYAEALVREMEALAPEVADRRVTCVRITGGVPTLMPKGAVGKVLAAARKYFSVGAEAEVLMEIEPSHLKKDQVDEYLEAGVTRFNMQYPTLSFAEIKSINPPYDVADLKETAWLFKQRDFLNLGLEVLVGLPHQTLKSLCATVLEAQSLGAVEIKLVPFVLRVGTALADAAQKGEVLNLPSTEFKSRFWVSATEALRRYNYLYEGDGTYVYAGHESSFNAHRLAGADVVGIGAGAVSRYGGFTYRNASDLDLYIAKAEDAEAICQQAAVVDDETALRIRAYRALCAPDGLNPAAFAARAGRDLDAAFLEALDRLAADGHLEKCAAVSAPAASDPTPEGCQTGTAAFAYKKTPLGYVDIPAFEQEFWFAD